MTYRFPSLLRAELFRIRRQRSNWLLPVVPLAGLALLAALTITSYGLTDLHGKTVLQAARELTDTATLVLEMSLGIPVLLLASRTSAHDYAYGTIRVLIGGGAGRLSVVVAKLTANLVMAACALVIGVALASGVGLLSPVLAQHLGSLPATYWREVALDVTAIAISLACCAILGTFTSTVSRSVAVGVTAAMVWFPTENILTGALTFVVATTHSNLASRATGWLLAPNLDHLIQALQPWRSTIEFGAVPLGESHANPVGPVGAEQGLLVIGVWAAFLLLASMLSVVTRIDVKE